MIRLLKIVGVLVLLPPVLWVLIIVLNVRLPLTMLNGPLSAAATYALGRDIRFDGEIHLAPTLVPTLEITHVSIPNLNGNAGYLAQLGRVYLEIDLLSLLSRKIVIEEFLAQEVRIALIVEKDGSNNWILHPPPELSGDEEGDAVVDMGEENEWGLAADIRRVEFVDVSLSYADAARGPSLLFELNRLEGRLRWSQDILLEGEGQYQRQPWALSITGGSLRDLMQRRPGWQVSTEVKLAGLHLRHQLELLPAGGITKLSLKGSSLATLSTVAGLGLPDWGPYELAGTLAVTTDAYSLRDLKLQVGDSQLTGTLKLRLEDEIPHLHADLSSQTLQMDDFRVAQTEIDEPVARETTAEIASPSVDLETYLSAETLGRFRGELTLVFDEVLSGDDRLGSGHLSIRAGGDRVTVESLHVNIPGGDIDLAGEIIHNNPGYQLNFKLDVDNFDYGVLARRRKPNSELQGTFFLKLDLQSTTPDLNQAMAHGNGSLDFAVWPQEFQSGVFNLWAVGLISAALNQFESEAVVNCLVARFDLANGVMHERSLMIDTSEIRVLGDAVLDFREQTVDVVLVPKAKKRQFISAATPLQLVGSFEDFEPRIKTSDVAFSVVRSGFNIALLGIPLLFQQTLDADGTADCQRAMEEDMRLGRRRE